MRKPRIEYYVSENGYGRNWTLWFGDRQRVRWHTTGATTRMWPQLRTGADENCNRSISLILWPLGHLDIWWEIKWRSDEDGMCESCKEEFGEA